MLQRKYWANQSLTRATSPPASPGAPQQPIRARQSNHALFGHRKHHRQQAPTSIPYPHVYSYPQARTFLEALMHTI